MSNAALSVHDLTVRYGGVKALDGVSFEVAHGEVRGLIGPNGSGKSTFINAVTGLRRSGSGRVKLFGQDITGFAPEVIRRLGLSRSFQHASIFPLLTVRHQINLVTTLFHDESADEILETLELSDRRDQIAAELSYGEQRRLDLALAMVGNPRFLLLDEPAAGLSREESLAMANLLRLLVRRFGVGVLLVEHDMDIIFSISDRITVFDTGRIIADGEPQEVRRDPAVRKAYLGSEG